MAEHTSTFGGIFLGKVSMEITLRTRDISRYKRTQDAVIVYTQDKVYVCVKEQKIDFAQPNTTLILRGKRYEQE